MQTFEAVSTARGELLWNFTGEDRQSEMNLYTPQYIPDITGDGIPDIINIHGGDPFGEPGMYLSSINLRELCMYSIYMSIVKLILFREQTVGASALNMRGGFYR